MSLDLDTRQRAMLQEMGVHVWLPPTELDEPVLAVSVEQLPPVVLAPAAASRATLPPPLAQSAAVPADRAPLPSAAAIEDRAVEALQARAGSPKPVKPAPTVAATGTPNVLAAGVADMDWPALTDAVSQCQACPLCTDRRAPVFGGADAEAPRRADWLVVGEPPDDAEERQGAPFAEQAGQLLDNMLKAVRVSRRQAPGEAGELAATQAAYVTNVVKCRPAVARNPSPQELAVCEHFLRREVALVQPKVILAMGRFAAQTLLQGSLPEGSKLPFGKLRGQVYRYQGIPVIVTYHPSYLLRTQADKARAWADLCLALAAVKGED
jgi:DNA polymerase